MSMDESELMKIATLARIRIPEDQRETLAHDLAQILHWVEQLQEVDTRGVEPLAGVVQTALCLRPDEVVQDTSSMEILAAAPAHIGPYFVVPKMIE